MANIILNGNCNRKCVYCFSRLKERKDSQLSLDNLTFICDFFNRSKKKKINILHLRDSPWVDGPGRTILETGTRIDPEKYGYYIGAFCKTKDV